MSYTLGKPVRHLAAADFFAALAFVWSFPVALNRNTASGALAEYVDRVMPLTLLAEEGGRSLYQVNR